MLAMKSKKLQTMFPVNTIEGRIHLIRGRKVILDRDPAELYGASTKALNQAVKGNAQRFPDEFVLRLTKEEADTLGSQFVTLNEAAPESRRGKHLKYLPYAFTKHGALMAANVLRSPRAVQNQLLFKLKLRRLKRADQNCLTNPNPRTIFPKKLWPKNRHPKMLVEFLTGLIVTEANFIVTYPQTALGWG